ncbi:MAG: aldo/keto reductase [Halanaerobiaceae bacterium]
MEYTNLGNSGLMVSDVCLGTMIFGEENERGTDRETAIQMINSYLEAGGNFIDTADVYAGGASEKIVGEAIKNKNMEDIVLATKVRFPTGEKPNHQGLSRKHILEGCEASLKRLGVDTIDLYYVHMWDPVTPLRETMKALQHLIDSGKVKYIGVSNFKAWQLMKAMGLSKQEGLDKFIAAQYQYSLVERNIDREFIPLFKEEGLGLVPWSPLGGGFLTGKYEPDQKPEEGRIAVTPDESEESWQHRNKEKNWEIIGVMEDLANKYDKTYPQIALNWLRCKDYVDSVIIGARTPEQLTDDLGGFDWFMEDEDVERLDKVSAVSDIYPYRMIDG